jgi:signal transduction histidine kinase
MFAKDPSMSLMHRPTYIQRPRDADYLMRFTGLGLAIARKAMDAHGGDIHIHNLPGKGCICVMEMPLSPSA